MLKEREVYQLIHVEHVMIIWGKKKWDEGFHFLNGGSKMLS